MHSEVTKCLGLVTQYNPLTLAPGALLKADNCVINRENVLEDRRGHKLYATSADQVSQFLTYQGRVISNHSTTLSYDNGSGTFADYSGTYSPPTSEKMRYVEANSNLYSTTTTGVKVFTDITGTAGRSSGAPRSTDPSYTLTGASGFLANNGNCAYKVLIKRTDANSNVLFGYPSQRLFVNNASGGSRNVILTVYLPSEVTTADVIQVYRTASTTTGTTDNAGDEMALVYQANPTSGEISAGNMAITDSIDDALRGASLYTSPSQEGIAQANERPPLCKDVALYKSNFMFYANTSTKHRLYVSLIGTSGLNGKTITLDGTTYTFNSTPGSENASTRTVEVTTSGTSASNIDLTARSLIRVINRYASNTTTYAFYLSEYSDLPGKILVEARSVGGSAFTLNCSDTTIAGMFFPNPPVSPSTNTASTSSNTVQKNGLFYSKFQQLEAVPLLNYVLVGPANKNILRIAPLRDSLIIIKEEGVYRLTGNDANSFVVTPLDLTVFCKATDSVVVLANQVFMLSNQGVVRINDSGVEVISRSIEPSLKPLIAFTSLSTYTTGLGYESDRLYILSTMTASTDTAQTQTFVYNFFTKCWTRWTFAFNAAVIDPTNDKIIFSKPSDVSIYAERKDFLDTDYADPETAITITGITGNYVTFTIGSGSPDIGWSISQGGTEIPILSIVTNSASFTALMTSDVPASWTTGAATIYPNVGMSVIWHSFNGGEGAAAYLKQVREFAILTDNIPGNNSITSVVPNFYTNLDGESEEVAITLPGGGWGGSWGEIPWGGSGDAYGYRTWLPMNKQYSTRLNAGFKHKNAREKIAVVGCAYEFSMVTEVSST